MKRVVTGIDIGTSKVCAAILGLTETGRMKIGGIGVAPAKGINKGFVSNLDKLVDSIDTAVGIAEDKAGVTAHQVVANISGPSVSGKVNEGLMPLSKRGREITKRDITKIIDMTKDISFSLDREFLYYSPQEFIVNDNESVEDPIGLFGTKLKVKLYLITALVTHIQNITRAINYAGYDLLDIVPTSVALASCALKDEEKDKGALIIDMGGGITEVAIYGKNNLRFFDSVNVGGMDLTAHLSARYRIPFENAEEMKRKYGNLSPDDFKKGEKNTLEIDKRRIVVEGSIMNRLLKERFDEIFYILKDRLAASGYPPDCASAVVVFGGGALLNGALETFERLFNVPVKMGYAAGIEGGDPSILANPVYSAAISLAKYGLDKHVRTKSRAFKPNLPLAGLLDRFRDFLEDYF